MEPIAAKDFLGKLKTGNFKPSSKLMGFVKKSEKDSELLFAFKHDLSNWISIPESMIESAMILENFSDGENPLTLVKLYLKAPSAGEAKTLYDLLAILSTKVNKYQKIKWMKKMLFGEEAKEEPMQAHWKHFGMEGRCGHHWEKEHSCSHHS